MKEINPVSTLQQRKKKQLLITFIISIGFSSLLVFFAVYSRTAQLLEQEKIEAKASESSDSNKDSGQPVKAYP